MSIASELDPRTSIGANNPPPLKVILTENYVALTAEVEAIAERANLAPRKVTDDDGLGVIGDLVKDAAMLARKADSMRKAEKEPHLTAGREIDAFFATFTDRLDRIRKVFEAVATDYQRAKAAEARRKAEDEARRLREEEERQREIARRAEEANRAKTAAKADDRAEDAAEKAAAAEALANASAAELTRTRSASGTLATAKTEWTFEVVDLDAIPLDRLRPYLRRDDIEKAIRQFVRVGHRELPGVRIFEDVRAAFR